MNLTCFDIFFFVFIFAKQQEANCCLSDVYPEGSQAGEGRQGWPYSRKSAVRPASSCVRNRSGIFLNAFCFANNQPIPKPAPAPASHPPHATNGILSVAILSMRNLQRPTDAALYCMLAYDQQQFDTRESAQLFDAFRFDVLDSRNPLDVTIWVYDGACMHFACIDDQGRRAWARCALCRHARTSR